MGMREEFEAAMRELFKNEQYDDFSIDLMFEVGSNGEYRSIRVAGAWWGWQASRAALVLDFTPCNVQHASYNQVDCYSINDVKVIAGQYGVGVRTK